MKRSGGASGLIGRSVSDEESFSGNAAEKETLRSQLQSIPRKLRLPKRVGVTGSAQVVLRSFTQVRVSDDWRKRALRNSVFQVCEGEREKKSSASVAFAHSFHIFSNLMRFFVFNEESREAAFGSHKGPGVLIRKYTNQLL